MELNIGSNIIRNTTGILNVRGKNQITVELGKNSGQLLLNMDVYDAAGQHVAKLRRNAWTFNTKERFDITTAPESLKLTDKDTGQVVVEAKVTGKNQVTITNGAFYTHSGELLEISPTYWRIGGITMSGNVFDGVGGAVAIG
jgi:hypothetical protein